MKKIIVMLKKELFDLIKATKNKDYLAIVNSKINNMIEFLIQVYKLKGNLKIANLKESFQL